MNYEQLHPRCSYCEHYQEKKCKIKERIVDFVIEACFCDKYNPINAEENEDKTNEV